MGVLGENENTNLWAINKDKVSLEGVVRGFKEIDKKNVKCRLGYS